MKYLTMEVDLTRGVFGESMPEAVGFNLVEKVCIKLPRGGATYEISTDNGQLRIRSEAGVLVTLGQYFFDE